MITSVKLEGCYDHPRDVPRIGQRKRMRLTGSMQLMTLNQIEATRRITREFSDSKERDVWVTEFNTTEIWGEFYL